MSESKAIVFVVDDDVSIREALESLIRSAGFKVETFAIALIESEPPMLT
jgi:FixJ family two-component response regulator